MNTKILLKDRQEAGKRLGDMLRKLSYFDSVVLGLPMGGMIVAHEVAKIMSMPLDVVVSCKIGSPKFPNFSIGAISEDEIPLFTPESVKHVSHTSDAVLEVVSHERTEMRRRIDHFRHKRSLVAVKGKIVIVVNEGIETGATAAAAGRFLRTLEPLKLVLAVAVGGVEMSSMVKDQFDEIICLEHVKDFKNVKDHYETLPDVSDREVLQILKDYHPDTAWAEQRI